MFNRKECSHSKENINGMNGKSIEMSFSMLKNTLYCSRVLKKYIHISRYYDYDGHTI